MRACYKAGAGAAALVLAAVSCQAGWCGPSVLQFVLSGSEEHCSANVIPGQPIVIEVYLESHDRQDFLREAAFRLENWPDGQGGVLGDINESWTADIASGTLETGRVLSWDPPLAPFHDGGGFGQRFYLGSIEVVAHSPDWIGDDHRVVAADVSFCDDYGIRFPGDPEQDLYPFVFNGGCVRPLIDPPIPGFWDAVSVISPPDGALVQPGFQFVFEVESWCCWYSWGWGYAGELRRDGELIVEFDGSGGGDYSPAIDLSGYDDGSQVELSLHVVADSVHDIVRHYTVDTIAADAISLSAVKSRYRE